MATQVRDPNPRVAVAGFALNTVQKPADVAYSTTGVRL